MNRQKQNQRPRMGSSRGHRWGGVLKIFTGYIFAIGFAIES